MVIRRLLSRSVFYMRSGSPKRTFVSPNHMAGSNCLNLFTKDSLRLKIKVTFIGEALGTWKEYGYRRPMS